MKKRDVDFEKMFREIFAQESEEGTNIYSRDK